MIDEERSDEQAPEAEAPQEDAPEEQAPEQQVPDAVDQAPTAEPPPEEAQQGETPAEEPKAEEPKPEESSKKEPKREAVPGAELDPIALEPERELSAEERARQEAEAEERARREAELTSDEADDAPVVAKPAKLSGDARYLATGRRKSSVARVMLTPGKGSIKVNERSLEEYFPRPYLQTIAKQALTQAGYEGNVDVRVRVHGGGISGQASAVRHGIARALLEIDPALRPELKRRGMLTRDSRVKERRKAGLKKARKRPQFSKR